MTSKNQVKQRSAMKFYSHTRLKTFMQCPLKYKFAYVDEEPPRSEGVEGFVGNRVHEALEKLYRDLWDRRWLNRPDELKDFYALRWNEKWHHDVRVVRRGETPDDYFSYGMECIDNFYRENFPFEESRTVALEERIEFAFDWSGQRRFQGYADRVASRPDGTYEIHDYKTSRSRKTPGESELRQLSLYQVGLQSMHPEVTQVELVAHFLSTGETFRQRQSRTDLVQIIQDANRVIDGIESERRFPANVTPLCDWCEFQEICPAWVE
jgi:putative RecB family exonuclease